MKRFFTVTVLMLSACAGTSPTKADAVSNALESTLVDAVIITRSATPPFTGVVKTWIALTARVDGRSVEVLIPYFSETQDIPQVGEVCSIGVVKEEANGIAGNRMINGVFSIVTKAGCHN